MSVDPGVDAAVDSLLIGINTMASPKPLIDAAIRPLFTADITPYRLDLVVAVLSSLRLMTRKQVEAILFDGAGMTARSKTVVASRLLLRATNHGVITRFPYDGRFVYCLERNKPRGLAQVSHDLSIADAVIAFVQAARARGHEIEHLETGTEYWSVRPDAYLVYGTPDRLYHYFIELDLGTMNARAWLKKIEGYVELYRSETWRSLFRTWPVVLTVANTDTRAKFLKRITETVDTKRSFYFTTLHRLQRHGPLAAIWFQARQEGRRELL